MSNPTAHDDDHNAVSDAPARPTPGASRPRRTPIKVRRTLSSRRVIHHRRRK